jgi:transposase InsO family protein
MRHTPDQQLTLMALAMAVHPRRICPGLIHNSIKGPHYSYVAYQRKLITLGITPMYESEGQLLR